MNDIPETPADDLTRQNIRQSSEELELLREKREALESLVRIAVSIRHMRQSLMAVTMMGESAADIPTSMLRLFKKLSEGVRHYSTAKLQQSLEILEDKIRGTIEHVMELAENHGQLEQEYKTAEELHELISSFRRRAQTAVSLGLLLRQRGISPSRPDLPISREQIKSRIEQLRSEEAQCRVRIRNEITDMQQWITRLLMEPNIPESMQLTLNETLAMLATNLMHLDEGRQLDEMPIVFEMVEMGTEEDHNIPFSPTSLPQESPVAAPEAAAPDTGEEPCKDNKKRGFLSRFNEWITTPMDVRWSDISKKKKPRR